MFEFLKLIGSLFSYPGIHTVYCSVLLLSNAVMFHLNPPFQLYNLQVTMQFFISFYSNVAIWLISADGQTFKTNAEHRKNESQSMYDIAELGVSGYGI